VRRSALEAVEKVVTAPTGPVSDRCAELRPIGIGLASVHSYI
jgi:hypothetical protein